MSQFAQRSSRQSSAQGAPKAEYSSVKYVEPTPSTAFFQRAPASAAQSTSTQPSQKMTQERGNIIGALSKLFDAMRDGDKHAMNVVHGQLCDAIKASEDATKEAQKVDGLTVSRLESLSSSSSTSSPNRFAFASSSSSSSSLSDRFAFASSRGDDDTRTNGGHEAAQVIGEYIKQNPNEDPYGILNDWPTIVRMAETLFNRRCTGATQQHRPRYGPTPIPTELTSEQKKRMFDRSLKNIIQAIIRCVLRPLYKHSKTAAKRLPGGYDPVDMIKSIVSIKEIREILLALPTEWKTAMLFSLFWSNYNLVLYDEGKPASREFDRDMIGCFDILRTALNLSIFECGHPKDGTEETALDSYTAATRTLVRGEQGAPDRYSLRFSTAVAAHLTTPTTNMQHPLAKTDFQWLINKYSREWMHDAKHFGTPLLAKAAIDNPDVPPPMTANIITVLVGFYLTHFTKWFINSRAHSTANRNNRFEDVEWCVFQIISALAKTSAKDQYEAFANAARAHNGHTNDLHETFVGHLLDRARFHAKQTDKPTLANISGSLLGLFVNDLHFSDYDLPQFKADFEDIIVTNPKAASFMLDTVLTNTSPKDHLFREICSMVVSARKKDSIFSSKRFELIMGTTVLGHVTVKDAVVRAPVEESVAVSTVGKYTIDSTTERSSRNLIEFVTTRLDTIEKTLHNLATLVFACCDSQCTLKSDNPDVIECCNTLIKTCGPNNVRKVMTDLKMQFECADKSIATRTEGTLFDLCEFGFEKANCNFIAFYDAYIQIADRAQPARKISNS